MTRTSKPKAVTRPGAAIPYTNRPRPLSMWNNPSEKNRIRYLPMLPNLGDWASRGACRGLPEAQARQFIDPGPENEYAAKQVCAGCPVRYECLVDAMQVERARPACDRATIRGGDTPGERWALYCRIRQMRRRKPAAEARDAALG